MEEEGGNEESFLLAFTRKKGWFGPGGEIVWRLGFIFIGLSMSIFLCVLLICAIMHLFLCFLDVLSQDFFSLLLFVSFGKCCDFSSYNLLSFAWECPS